LGAVTSNPNVLATADRNTALIIAPLGRRNQIIWYYALDLLFKAVVPGASTLRAMADFGQVHFS
jgi:hypothetical protein